MKRGSASKYQPGNDEVERLRRLSGRRLDIGHIVLNVFLKRQSGPAAVPTGGGDRVRRFLAGWTRLQRAPAGRNGPRRAQTDWNGSERDKTMLRVGNDCIDGREGAQPGAVRCGKSFRYRDNPL